MSLVNNVIQFAFLKLKEHPFSMALSSHKIESHFCVINFSLPKFDLKFALASVLYVASVGGS